MPPCLAPQIEEPSLSSTVPKDDALGFPNGCPSGASYRSCDFRGAAPRSIHFTARRRALTSSRLSGALHRELLVLIDAFYVRLSTEDTDRPEPLSSKRVRPMASLILEALRIALTVVLFFFGWSLLLAAAPAVVWGHRVLMSEDRFVALGNDVLERKAVQAALTERLAVEALAIDPV